MKKLSIIFSVIAILVSPIPTMASIVECSSSTMCQISIFQSSLPNTYHKYSFQMIPPVDASGNPVQIPAGNSVEFKFESVSAAIICDNIWHSLSPVAVAGEIQNRIKCTVDSSRTGVSVYLQVYDQDTYTNTYSSPPSYTYSELNNTDKTSPVCTAENILAASAACKWQKQNVNDTLLNERGVPLNYWVVYARTAVDGLSMGYSVDSGDATPYESSDSVCAVDSNGNGTVDPGEIQACVQIGETQFCPVDAAECIATNSDAICPAGSMLNLDTDKCEATPNISCPAGGYAYNSDIDTCAINVACPQGGGLNPNSDLCEIVVTSDLCPAGYTYNSTLDACTKAVVCAEGGTYNSSADKCETSYTAACPDGYVYNSSIQKCEHNPICPSGSSYNNTYNKCIKAVVSLTCPSDYSYNSSLEKCEKTPTCPSGSSYNISTDRCEMAVQWYCSVNGSTYSNQSTCSSNCSQIAQCTQSTPSVSITGNQFGAFTSAIVSGNSLIIRDNWSQPGVTIATINFSVGSLSGGFDGGRNELIGKIAASGQDLLFYNNVNVSTSEESIPTWHYLGKVTFTGITPSGSSSCEWSHRDAYYNYPSGNTIRFGCMGYPQGTITFTSSVVVNTCPLGAYTCTGNPPTCTKSGSCTSSCPSGYTKSGSLCIVNATCSSGGTLNISVDKCQYAPTYNCDSDFTYDSAIEYCTGSASCPDSGTLDTSVDKCRLTFTYSCPADYNYDSSTDKCESDPVCDYGYFDGSIDLCRLSASGICPCAATKTNVCLTRHACQELHTQPL